MWADFLFAWGEGRRQRLCLWTPAGRFDPLDTLLAIELVTSAYSVRVFIRRTYGSD